MFISLYDFAFLCTEPSLCKVKIWDLNKDSYVFEGSLTEAGEVDKFGDEIVQSFDPIDEAGFIINIDSSN